MNGGNIVINTSYLRPYFVRTEEVINCNYSKEFVPPCKQQFQPLPNVVTAEQTFANNFNHGVFLLFRDGTITFLPPTPDSFLAGVRRKPGLAMSKRYKGNNEEIEVFTFENCVNALEAQSSERLSLKRIIEKQSSNFTPKFARKVTRSAYTFQDEALVYVYRPYADYNERTIAKAMYWEDADVVICLEHPETLRVLHPFALVTRMLTESRSKLYNDIIGTDEGVVTLEAKLVGTEYTCIYIPVGKYVMKVSRITDPTMEQGIHLAITERSMGEKYSEFETSPGRYFIPIDKISDDNGIYTDFTHAKYVVDADIDLLTKLHSKLASLEADKERITLKEHAFQLDQAEAKLKHAQQLEFERLDRESKQQERQLRLEMQTMERTHKQKMMEMEESAKKKDRASSWIKFGMAVLPVALALFSFIFGKKGVI